jgi:hypothetical protein
MAVTLVASGCVLRVGHDKPSARDSLIAQIDRMVLLLNEKKYDLFIDQCLEPTSFTAMLKKENWTTSGFAAVMELKQYGDVTSSEFIAGVLALAKENVPEIQPNVAAVTVQTGHYVYPSFEFVKENDTWLWVIWPPGLREADTSEREKHGQQIEGKP